MKTIINKTLILVFVSSLLFSCTADDNEIENNFEEKTDITLNYSPIESEILNLINNHRANLELSSLNTFNIVSKKAITHTNYMIETGTISHANFEQRYQWLVSNANAQVVAENVAFGYNTAEEVVAAWINSNGHRVNIENPNFTDFGISIKSNSNGRYYFTNIFIKK